MMYSLYADLGVSLLDTDRAVLRAAVKRLPAWVRRDPCRRALRRRFYCQMLRYHAQTQRSVFRTCH
ncbi:MAG: hypothetical protein WA975_15795 [Mesorhizobium sp.]